MPNTMYDIGRRTFLQGGINWISESLPIRAMLVRTAGYTFDASHATIGAIDTPARVPSTGDSTGRGIVLVNRTVGTQGAARADNIQFVDVAAGIGQIRAVVLYADPDGNDANTTLIVWLDTATGLPITPNGGSIIVNWDTGINGIFRL